MPQEPNIDERKAPLWMKPEWLLPLILCATGATVALFVSAEPLYAVPLVGLMMAAILVVFTMRMPYLGICILVVLSVFRFRVPLWGGFSVSSAQIWLALLVMGYAFKAFLGHREKGSIEVEVLIGLFFLWSAFTLVGSPNSLHGLKQLVLWLLLACTFWVTRKVFSDRQNAEKLVYLVIAVGVIFALIGIVQFAVANYYSNADAVSSFIIGKVMPVFSSEAHVKHRVLMDRASYHSNWMLPERNMMRLISMFFGPIFAGTFLAMAAAVCFAVLIYIKKNILLLMVFAVLVLAVVLTFTRGAYVALAVSLVAVAFTRRANKSNVLLVMLFSLMAVSVFLFLTSLHEPVVGRVASESRTASKSLLTRWSYLQQGVLVVQTQPFKGVGFANYRDYVEQEAASLSSHSQYMKVWRRKGISGLVYPHNQYIQLWAETGIVGLALFLGILFVIMRKGLRILKERQDNLSQGLVAASLGAVVAYCVHALFEDIIVIPEILVLFWVMASLPYVVDKLSPNTGQIETEGTPHESAAG